MADPLEFPGAVASIGLLRHVFKKSSTTFLKRHPLPRPPRVPIQMPEDILRYTETRPKTKLFAEQTRQNVLARFILRGSSHTFHATTILKSDADGVLHVLLSNFQPVLIYDSLASCIRILLDDF